MTRLMTINLGDKGRPPDRFLVWPAGPVRTRLRAEPFILDDAAAGRILSDFRSGGIDLVIDYEHQTESGYQRSDGQAPAAGWITDLDWDPGVGLFAICNWTSAAVQALKNREYRYHSPVFICDGDGKLSRLKSVALTNVPATKSLPALVAREFSPYAESEKMEMLVPILEALGVDLEAIDGLEPAAVVAMIVEKVNEKNELIAELEGGKGDPPANGEGDGGDMAAASQVKTIRSILTLSDDQDVVQAVRDRVKVDLTKYSPVAVVRELKTQLTDQSGRVKALSDKLAAMESESRQRAEDDWIAELRQDGKIVAGNEQAYRQAFRADADQARKDSANYPKIVDTGDAGVRGGTAESGRASVIASARADYAQGGMDAKLNDLASYVDAALLEVGETPLTDDEKKTLD